MGNILNWPSKSKQQTFIIKISGNYTLKCSYIDSNNKEIIIKLHNKKEKEYLLATSLIDKNSSIEFADDLFTKPHDFKLYDIELYGKEYSIIAEVLFALIINEFKQQIEKEYIIENTLVELPGATLLMRPFCPKKLLMRPI